jgi:hypothetical protein
MAKKTNRKSLVGKEPLPTTKFDVKGWIDEEDKVHPKFNPGVDRELKKLETTTIICEPRKVYVITMVDAGVRLYLAYNARPCDNLQHFFTPFPLAAMKFLDPAMAMKFRDFIFVSYPEMPRPRVMQLVLSGEIFDNVDGNLAVYIAGVNPKP